MNTSCETSDLLVFSHLRWDFIFQRPQHLLSRHAKNRRVFYFEEPVFGTTDISRLHLRETPEGVLVVIPYLPNGLSDQEKQASLKHLVDELIYEEELMDYTLWYYTPSSLSFSDHLQAKAVIYDCIDERSSHLEDELFKKADLVFTSGQSLYDLKKEKHHNIHPFPNSIDFEHFSQGRLDLVEPEDQINIPHPRIGFYGVIDERIDLDLLGEMADLRPDYHFVVIGPTVNLDSTTLPNKPNIHYLGRKEYHALPIYLAGWDCAMMPFAMNESTKFISPTKTPEFLAAGKPVISTPITDVINPYGEHKLVYIADKANTFNYCITKALGVKNSDPNWLKRVDNFLEGKSWDTSFLKMMELEKETRAVKQVVDPKIIITETLSSANEVM